jgi:hypothetical protein
LNHANVPKAQEKVRLCCGDVGPGHRNLEQIGAPAFDDETREFARAIQTNLEMPPMDDPFVADIQRRTPPAEFEATVVRSLPPTQFRIGADDDALHPGWQPTTVHAEEWWIPTPFSGSGAAERLRS